MKANSEMRIWREKIEFNFVKLGKGKMKIPSIHSVKGEVYLVIKS